MAKLPLTYSLPLKEDSIRAAGEGDNEDFYGYMKTLIKRLNDMYVEISNAVNLGGDIIIDLGGPF